MKFEESCDKMTNLNFIVQKYANIILLIVTEYILRDQSELIAKKMSI